MLRVFCEIERMSKLNKNSRIYAASNVLPLTATYHSYGWDVRANGWHVASKMHETGTVTMAEDMMIYSGKIESAIAAAKAKLSK